MARPVETWAAGDAYEPYIGRWSRLVAREFVAWLGVAGGAAWLDVGCGTGALSQTVLEAADPAAVVGIDPSLGFLAHARARLDGPARLVVAGGRVAAYVWDYGGRMELIRRFWDAAAALDPAAATLDEGRRFGLCRPEPLAGLFRDAGLVEVAGRPIEVPTRFRDFDDFWTPFLGGQGPAPGYAMALDEGRRAALREELRARLPVAGDGSIPLVARAWAVAGTRAASPGPVSGG